MSIALGSTVKDVVTGYVGIAVSRVSHITRCDEYAITSKETLTGGSDWGTGAVFIDEGRLAVVKAPSKTMLTKLAMQTAEAIAEKNEDEAQHGRPDPSLFRSALPG